MNYALYYTRLNAHNIRKWLGYASLDLLKSIDWKGIFKFVEKHLMKNHPPLFDDNITYVIKWWMFFA